MEKRLISALAVSVLIILAFQYFTIKPPVRPPATIESPQAVSQQAKEAYLGAPKESLPMVAETETVVETDRYIMTFSNIGGAIKNIRLKNFKDQLSGEPLELVKIKNQTDYLFNISGIGGGTNLSLSGYTLTRAQNAISYSLVTENWDITKKYILHNNQYGIELQLFIKNRTDSSKDFNYRIISGAGVSESTEEGKRFIEVTASINGNPVGFKSPKEGRTINIGTIKWTALKNKYFSLILKPMVTAKGQFYTQDGAGQLVAGVEVDSVAIQPGATVENKFILYVGPSHIPALKAFGYDFEETINYGFFGVISKAILAVLGFFYSLFHSWGLAVILLSIFLNIILFPLTVKSFQSMQKMQALHPQMEKLKSQHKDNPQKLNKEIMELYKKYKINPFSGCLPMLLQMPIFIALYQALMKSIELRHTKFLWINDLSAPDAVRIPITLPVVGNSINILPLIMVGAMVMQQKMSTKTAGAAVSEEQKQQQKMMLIIMPIMFGFIFYNMPSGLVLYWVINTSLTIIEQMAMMKNTAVEV
jgi:YidC/Oxa1 family membrane protein insertase